MSEVNELKNQGIITEKANVLEENLLDAPIKEVRIIPDSSWLIALLDETDSHYKAAHSSLGALLPYKPTFYIVPIVYLETISRLIRKKKTSVKKCYEKIESLLGRLDYKHKTTLDMREIVQKYKKFSRMKLKLLTPVDFYIVAEGILLDGRILTCDYGMYFKSQKYYDKIYFLSDKASKKTSDSGRLISEIQTS